MIGHRYQYGVIIRRELAATTIMSTAMSARETFSSRFGTGTG
jgi:hypothetical protein